MSSRWALVSGMAIILALLLAQQIRHSSPPPGQRAGTAGTLGRVASVPVEHPGSLQVGVEGEQAQVHLEEETAPDAPDFTERDLHVKVGQVVTLTLRNTSDPALNYFHSWVLVKPGTEDQMVAVSEQSGSVQDWIPDSPEVLAHTGMLAPGETQTIAFRAPAQPGDYPFLCLFPEHGTRMRGTLHVSR